MRAIVMQEAGGPEVLELKDIAEPAPGYGQVRVRVHATAVNRADLVQRMGRYPAPPDCPPDILGLEYAGVVDAVGDGVSELSVGDRVFGLVGGGSYAEKLVTHARTAAKIPEGMSFADAAACPEAFITAYDAVVAQANLRPGETLLVHAVGSGVGTAAAQIGRIMGARVLGTARSKDKLGRAEEFGLDEGIVPNAGKFAEDVLRVTGDRGADVVLDLVGGDYVSEDVLCTNTLGRILVVGLVGGPMAELALAFVLRKRLRIMGTALRSRELEEKIEACQLFSNEIVPRLAKGDLRPVVHGTMALEEARVAHELLASNATFGKIVLTVD